MTMRAFVTGVLALGLGATLSADVILSSANLNDALKKMERIRQSLPAATGTGAAELRLQLAVEADALTTLINDEVAEHGSQEKALIDLGLRRTRDLGVSIAYDAAKKKFFYDGAGFREYLEVQPKGQHAAGAHFKLIELDFFRGTGTDVAALEAAALRKQQFVRQYASYPNTPEVHLMLSVDYRDLYRHYKTAGQTGTATKYRDLTRQQLRLLTRSFPEAEQAEIARRMLQRFEDELRTK